MFGPPLAEPLARMVRGDLRVSTQLVNGFAQFPQVSTTQRSGQTQGKC
jgi:hypothetical protein